MSASALGPLWGGGSDEDWTSDEEKEFSYQAPSREEGVSPTKKSHRRIHVDKSAGNYSSILSIPGIRVERNQPTPDIQHEDMEDDQDQLRFAATIMSIFRASAFDFHASHLELTPGELFSMAIGCPYRSAHGATKIIEGTQSYFQRVYHVMEKYCRKADRSRARFTLPQMINQNGEISL
jgi:hypothetical protein